MASSWSYKIQNWSINFKLRNHPNSVEWAGIILRICSKSRLQISVRRPPTMIRSFCAFHVNSTQSDPHHKTASIQTTSNSLISNHPAFQQHVTFAFDYVVIYTPNTAKYICSPQIIDCGGCFMAREVKQNTLPNHPRPVITFCFD